MAAELPRPGVEVLQVFRTVTPTVITPTLVPNVVGVAKEIVELFEQDASGSSVLNGDALVTLPALILAAAGSGSPAEYAGLHGLALVLSINNGPSVTVTFSDPLSAGLTPASVVAQILAAFSTAGVTAATAETVGDTTFRIRTLGVGEFQSILVVGTTASAVLTAFGIGAGKTYTGVGNYRQYELLVPSSSFPAPRGNLDELVVEASSIRAFLSTGSGAGVRELSRTEAFLRQGQVDDAAVVTGNVDLTGLTLPGDIQTKTFSVKVDGGTTQIVTFTSGATTPTLLVGEINSQTTGLVASIVAGSNFLRLTADSFGADSSIEIIAGGNALVTVGVTAGVYVGSSIEVVDDGNGDVFSPILDFANENFAAAGTAAVVTGNVAVTGGVPASLNTQTLEVSDGQLPQTITFNAPANGAAVLSQINAVLGTAAGGRITATLDGSNFLVLTHSRTGQQSYIEILGGTAVTTLGLTVAATRGGASKAVVGDELWIDGVKVGSIVAVAVGGLNDRLKIDQSLTISKDIGKDFYIVAKGLSATPAVDRPYPELVVSLDGSVVMKNETLRDTSGVPLTSVSGRAPIYLTYTAVRQDVSPLASNAGLLRVDSVEQLESMLSPINTQNPLALGLYFALINAPGVQVTGLGVDSISADAPFGTVEAFSRAAEFLEAFEIYAIAPLTHDQTVAQVFNTHVSFMSDSEQKGERIVLFNSKAPTNKLDALVASGANGNSVGSGGTQFDTGVTNLSALLLNGGVNPSGTIPVSAGVFLDLASDSKRYSVSGVSGSIVTIRTSFVSGENDDGYYATTDLNDPPLASVLVNETFAVRVRGASLTNVDGTPNKQAMAETYAGLSSTFLNRRFWHTAPDRCGATIDGLEQAIEGFYMNAGIVGLISQQVPQQSFTNFPMAGYTRVFGSNDFFSEKQMNIMAGGGTYIIVQDTPGAPLIARMALTTDLTSIETRTDSITKIVDFTAKFLRRGLKNFIGRFNITQGFLDSLGTVVQGLLGFLVENGTLIAGSLNNIIQDEDAPDTVLIDVTLDVPYPCNYLRLTLLI
jgi:hypothetical protein